MLSKKFQLYVPEREKKRETKNVGEKLRVRKSNQVKSTNKSLTHFKLRHACKVRFLLLQILKTKNNKVNLLPLPFHVIYAEIFVPAFVVLDLSVQLPMHVLQPFFGCMTTKLDGCSHWPFANKLKMKKTERKHVKTKETKRDVFARERQRPDFATDEFASCECMY